MFSAWREAPSPAQQLPAEQRGGDQHGQQHPQQLGHHTMMPATRCCMKIDFVSDVACPWCAVGLYALEEALRRVGPGLPVELHFQPFELNPQMPPEGEDAAEHLARKYGASRRTAGASTRDAAPARRRARLQLRRAAARLEHLRRAPAAALGRPGRPAARAEACAAGRVPHACAEPGLARGAAARCAKSSAWTCSRPAPSWTATNIAEDVRERERFYQEQGISAVPSVIIDDRHLIQGGQPPEVFERALRTLAAEAGSMG